MASEAVLLAGVELMGAQAAGMKTANLIGQQQKLGLNRRRGATEERCGEWLRRWFRWQQCVDRKVGNPFNHVSSGISIGNEIALQAAGQTRGIVVCIFRGSGTVVARTEGGWVRERIWRGLVMMGQTDQ